jgi:hypothetical protein
MRLAPLTLCLSTALSLAPNAQAERSFPSGPEALEGVAPSGATIVVENCDDDGAGSLRAAVAAAASGDEIDLSGLPVSCGMAESTITLTSGELFVIQDDLTLRGPDIGAGSVTLSGAHASRVVNHQGTGTLAIDSLTIADGRITKNDSARGGCIASSGDLTLASSLVTGCIATSMSGLAYGGGIFANTITLLFSAVSSNTAKGSNAAYGGGAYAQGSLTAKYSAVSNNSAIDYGFGGGIFVAGGSSSLIGSTVDGNIATYGGGLLIRGDANSIANSTVSNNTATEGAGIISIADSTPLSIGNSTIAFNHAIGTGGGVVAFSAISLESNIIAMNDGGVDADFLAYDPALVSGADNVIMGASQTFAPGVITVTEDPKLGPLQFNGGPTRTHALLRGSPAMGVGNNSANWLNDQRGIGYPRTTNGIADIGAFQFDSIFVDSFD